MKQGQISGGTAFDRAVRLSGGLAELGVARLAVMRPQQAAIELLARGTDLPGCIAAAPTGTVIEATTPSLRVVLLTDALSWETADEGAAQRLDGA